MISEESRKKIINELEASLDDILEDNPSLSEIREVKTAIDWYRKTREGTVEPGKILGMINRLIINNISEPFLTEFSNSLEQKLTETSIQKTQSGTTFSMFLPGLQTSTDVVLAANGVDVGRITIGLLQDTGVVMQGIRQLSNVRQKQIEIEKIVFSINLYVFAKMIIGTKRKKIGQKEFELRNIVISQ